MNNHNTTKKINTKSKHIRFIKKVLVFFLPVLLVYICIDLAILQIPQSFQNKASYLKTNKQDIELLSFGSSQMQNAINPEHIGVPSINFSSTSQHHRLDFEILKQIKNRLPKLKTVVFELSYSHLELPHNSKEFWKNTIYYNFFDINAFGRKTYFKDRLLFISRPDFYARALKEFYITNKNKSVYNKYGFKTNDTLGKFFRLKYDPLKIAKQKVEINTKPNRKVFTYNTAYFETIMNYTLDQNLEVIIVTLPMYKTFLKQRNQSILHRRDSILLDLQNKYTHLKVFRKEQDTIKYNVHDFKNESHLNSFGAEKYTKELNRFLEKK